jgi:hypothetical protein
MGSTWTAAGHEQLALCRSAHGVGALVDWMSRYGAFWRDRFAKLRTLA